MSTNTQHLPPPISNQITFLNATVLSFNGSLGFGSQESTITVELIEDCETNPPQVFANGLKDSLIGTPQIFPENGGGMDFSFHGIVTNWNKNDTSSGVTYTVTLSDPRRILESVAIIIDTYSGSIANNVKNIYNVYNSYEPPGSCQYFGESENINERGMPYRKIIQKLNSLGDNLVVYPPTGNATFIVNLSGLPSGLPPYYRANGPAISLLQLITDVCDATGHDFYIYQTSNSDLTRNTINIVPINLKQNPEDSFNWIQNYGVGNPDLKVTDRSFGRELRIEKQKNLILGEKIHYMNMGTDFLPFFGENQACNPVVAENEADCGFKVLVNTTPLVASMRNPGVFENGDARNLYIYEIDLRCNYDLWAQMMKGAREEDLSPYTAKARQWYVGVGGVLPTPESAFPDLGNASTVEGSKPRSEADRNNNPGESSATLVDPKIDEDLKKIFGYIESLASTYYGKQFLAKIYDNICYRTTSDIINGGGECINSEVVYSAVPTNDGAWIEPGGSVMGVGDPYLGFFRQEDGRVGAFALFSVEGTTPPPDNIGDTTRPPSPGDTTNPPSPGNDN